MSKAMSLKAKIRNIAKQKTIPAQVILQNYMFERLLVRLSISEFKEKFVLKGGMLVAAIVGAVFVGIGAGIVVRQGGACAGDDALALVISKKLKIKISKAYLLMSVLMYLRFLARHRCFPLLRTSLLAILQYLLLFLGVLWHLLVFLL